MKIIFRVDSSGVIGSGHLMRCLALASILRKQGAEIFFICRELPGNNIELITEAGFQVLKLPYVEKKRRYLGLAHAAWLNEDIAIEIEQVVKYLQQDVVDWLVVDHYALDAQWETAIRPYIKNLMVIDDLADRRHNADILLDQNLYLNSAQRYQDLLPVDCKLLLGLEYALLREEFKHWKNKSHVRKTLARILISFGGIDSTNETMKALHAVKPLLEKGLSVDVVIGKKNPNSAEIEALCKQIPRVYYHCQAPNMAELMTCADLALGANGSMSWERFCLGLPTIGVSIADNQFAIANTLAELKLIKYLGPACQTTISQWQENINEFFDNPSLLAQISERTLPLVDGFGAARVVDMLLKK